MYPLFNLSLKGQPEPARLYLHGKWRLIDIAKENVECKSIVGCLHGGNSDTGLPFSSNIKRLKTIEIFVFWFDYKGRP